MTELLRELEAVVGLADKATPGEWLYRQGTAVVILGQGAGGFDLSACPQPAENAQAIASAVNFIRTHHAEIAEALMDAERYRWLREQQWESAGIFVVAGSKSAVKLGAYCPSQDRLDNAIDNSIAIEANNSAREVGE